MAKRRKPKVKGLFFAFFFLMYAFARPCLAAPPTNDDCADARTVTLGENAFTTLQATSAGPAMCVVAGGDVWFKFTSTFRGPLTISTCGDADFNTVIAAYSGCSCGSITLLGCNDNGLNCPGFTSKLNINVEAGQCYLIRLAGAGGATGTGVLTLTPADAQNAAAADHVLTGAAAGDRFGTSVAGNGRINAGSIEDLLVGAPYNDAGASNAGRAYAFNGADLDDNAPPLDVKTGGGAADQFGAAVALCDVNNDGRDDLIIGAPLADTNGTNSGHVYAYSGFNGSLLWSRAGLAPRNRFGFSVACAGDVNGDGVNDVIVGAPYKAISGQENRGRAYILNGSNGAVLKAQSGKAAGDFFGWAVAGIGDLTNDGKDDYAVGAPFADANGTDAGRVYIYSGANGSQLQRIDGDAANDKFGTSLAGMRFTASGIKYDVVAIGAPGNDAAGSNAGRVKVFYRNITNPSQGGCSKPLCLLWTINGGNSGDAFGSSVALGDLAGSAFVDIIVGAPRARFNGSTSGAVYVFNGATGGLVRRLFGEAPGDQLGTSVANAGDVNNGGSNDLIVGAPFNDANGSSAGRAYVLHMEIGSAPADANADDVALPVSDMEDDDLTPLHDPQVKRER